VAENGREAVKMHQANGYDLILMDIQMPHMNGYEATKSIRAHEYSSNIEVPIVGLSAHAFAEDRQYALRTGMNDYLAKPINSTVLNQMMMQYLPPSRAQKKQVKRIEVVENPVVHSDVDYVVLSKNVLQRLHSDLQGHLDELINAYDAELLVQKAFIQSVSDDSCLDDLRRSVHRLKGSSANLGALPLSRLSSDVEIIAKRDEMPSPKLLKDIVIEIDAVREALQEPWVQKLR
ncbi:MAG: response regulator, partial [Mariprofundaceae bacterium]|nr:response regulator [Mariprofundaceae bacterium]